MPLTPEEKKEMDELRQALEGGATPAVSLTLSPEEQAELTDLRKTLGVFGETPAPTAEEIETEFKEKVLSLPLGAIAGGTIGGITGGPPGAALGAAGGEATEQLIRRGVGAEAPETSEEAAKKIALEGALGGIGEVTGRALVRGGQIVGGALRPALRPGAPEIAKELQSAFPETRSIFNPIRRLFRRDIAKSPALLPAQTTENFLLDNIQEITKKSLIGGGRVIKAQQITDRVVSELAEDFTVKLTGGTGVTETGELIFDALSKGTDAFSAAGRGLYSQVDDVLGAARVNLKPVKAQAEKLLIKAKAGVRTKEQVKILTEILNKGDEVSFADAHTLRSDLLGVSRTGTELIGGRAQGVAKVLSKNIDMAMVDSARTIGPEAQGVWRSANEFWKQGKETFNSRFIRGLANVNPEEALNKVLQSGRPSNILKLRKTINDPEIWTKIQGQFANKVLNKAITDELSGALSGKALLKSLRLFGDDTVKAIAPKGELEPLRKFATALALNQAKQPGGLKGTVLINALQLTAGGKLIYDVAGGDIDVETVGAFGLVFGPLAFGRALTNPRVNKVLLEGFRVSPTAKAMTTFASRLGAVLAKENIEARIERGGEAETPTLPEGLATLPGAI